MPAGIDWDKEKIIEVLRKLHRSSKGISYGHVSKTNVKLAGAAVRYFGTYRAAVIAAGIDYDQDIRQQQRWTQQSIVREIRRRYRLKEDLSAGLMSKTAKPLYLASVSHFGSYRKAVLAGGIDYDTKVVRPPGWKWPEERVLAEIKRQHQLGKDMSYNAMRRRCEPLVFAAARRFGSYPKALKAAGIEPASVKAVRRWDPERVVAALKKLHKARKDLSSTALKRTNASLYAGARNHFPSFGAALAAAGIDFSSVRRIKQWTEEKVLRGLKRLHQSGKSLTKLDVDRKQSKLVAAAIRIFGSYETAVKKIGVDYADVRGMRVWTKPAVLQAIQARHAEGRSFKHRVVRKEDLGLLTAAQRRLGSWAKAIKAAGIDYGKVLDRWNKPKILDALRKLAATGQDMQRAVVLRVALRLEQAAKKYAGGYYTALAEAGIERPKKRDGKTGVTAGAAGHWTKESILKALTELHREGKVDLRYRPMKESHHSLFWAAKELFGSYLHAIVEAGINYDQVVKCWLRKGANAG